MLSNELTRLILKSYGNQTTASTVLYNCNTVYVHKRFVVILGLHCTITVLNVVAVVFFYCTLYSTVWCLVGVQCTVMVQYCTVRTVLS